MTRDFEYMNYDDTDRIAILENRAAELERRLLAALPPDGTPGWGNVAAAPAGRGALGDGGAQADGDTGAYDTGAYDAGSFGAEAFHTGAYPVQDVPGPEADADRYPDDADALADDADPGGGAPGPDERTEALINHGRSRARPGRSRRILRHWRMIAVGAVALVAGVIAALVVMGGGSASWPGSVATVRSQIKQACENPDVAAEPSGLNFACDKDTQQVLWVFSLLTSGNNPSFVDQSTGRKGLEPIQPSQGGDIAWSLNLHHPYNPANPVDSLQVAARAINNIISGATLTSTSGGALVEPGLESKAANCQRYTGSSNLVTKSGYPARCAAPVSGVAGEAALVSDVFQQWMGGTPSRIAQQAGVLFQNADNPGNAQVQAILNSLPASGG
jgi:hypothetical protein